MSLSLHPCPDPRRSLRAPSRTQTPVALAEDEIGLMIGEISFFAQLFPVPNVPLSPLEQEILSICLHSQEDPRDIGILMAQLTEKQGDAYIP
jgi:hypothetical protein